MASTITDLMECSQIARGTLERVNYFPRQLITVDDMVTERDYFLTKLRLHNRYLHGWGVVCGLDVTVPKQQRGTIVQIESGYALGPFGDEIYVPEPILFDLSKCGSASSTDPCDPSTVAGGPGIRGVVYIAIKYAECMARPVRALPAGCACDDDCEYSRIRDSFQIGCLDQPPPSPLPPSLCDISRGTQVVPCPPDPTDPWVVLAKVTVPLAPPSAAGGSNMKLAIDTSVRRIIVSSAVLQRQVIECCCEGHQIPPITPVPTVAPVTVEIKIAGQVPYTTNDPPKQIDFVFSKRIRLSDSSAIEITGPEGQAESLKGTWLYPSADKATFTPYKDAFISVGGTYDITVHGNKVMGDDNSLLDGMQDGKTAPPSDAKKQFTVQAYVIP